MYKVHAMSFYAFGVHVCYSMARWLYFGMVGTSDQL